MLASRLEAAVSTSWFHAVTAAFACAGVTTSRGEPARRPPERSEKPVSRNTDAATIIIVRTRLEAAVASDALLAHRRRLPSLIIPTPLPHPTVAPEGSTGYRPAARLPSARGEGRLALGSPRGRGARRRDSGSGGRATATSPSSVMSTAGASSGKNRIVLGVFDTGTPFRRYVEATIAPRSERGNSASAGRPCPTGKVELALWQGNALGDIGRGCNEITKLSKSDRERRRVDGPTVPNLGDEVLDPRRGLAILATPRRHRRS